MFNLLIKLIRKIKGFLLVLNSHFFIPSKFFETLAMMGKLSKFISLNKKNIDSDFYTFAFDYDRRYELYSKVIELENITEPIDYIELGVSMGYSFKWWAEKIDNSNSRFYGFDTFTGLPEDWGTFKKGEMSNGNEVPKMNDNRVKFYQGLFQKTIPDFLNEYKPNNRRVILFDADLYTSTIYGLTALNSIIKKGDIIMFDQFNVPNHEFKAFYEWTKAYYIKYQVIVARNNFYAVAIKIL